MKQPKPRDLYQVQVTTKEGKSIPVGPAMDRRQVPEEFAATINKAVAEGRERDWREARVVTVVPLTVN